MGLRFRIVHRKDGLKDAHRILSQEMTGALHAIGKRLQKSSVRLMKKDTGAQRASLQVKVKTNERVEVFSTLLQAYIDAYGLRRGIRVPFQPGSRLYTWASRNARTARMGGTDTERPPNEEAAGPRRVFRGNLYKHGRSKGQKVRRINKAQNGSVSGRRVRTKSRYQYTRQLAFHVARAIFRRGLTASHWNRKALEQNQAKIELELQQALKRAANRMRK